MNTCNTYIRIDFPIDNAIGACDLYTKILKWCGGDLGNLQDIIENSGISRDGLKSTNGEVTLLDFTAYSLFIDISGDTIPHMLVWRRLLEKYYPEAILLYRLYDSHTHLCVTNEIALYDLYRVEVAGNVEDCVDESELKPRIICWLNDIHFEFKKGDSSEGLNYFIGVVNRLVPDVRIDRWMISLASEWD